MDVLQLNQSLDACECTDDDALENVTALRLYSLVRQAWPTRP